MVQPIQLNAFKEEVLSTSPCITIYGGGQILHFAVKLASPPVSKSVFDTAPCTEIFNGDILWNLFSVEECFVPDG